MPLQDARPLGNAVHVPGRKDLVEFGIGHDLRREVTGDVHDRDSRAMRWRAFHPQLGVCGLRGWAPGRTEVEMRVTRMSPTPTVVDWHALRRRAVAALLGDNEIST